MIVKLLTEHYLEFLSLKGGCTGLSEATLVKMPHCWKSHAMAHLSLQILTEFAYDLHQDRLYTVLNDGRGNVDFLYDLNC